MRNSVDELFVEGTCNVFGVDFGACVSSVVPCFFYVFPPDFCLVCAYEGGDLFIKFRYAGILWRVLLVKFMCAILLRMGCGRSLSVLRILPTGMCFLPVW